MGHGRQVRAEAEADLPLGLIFIGRVRPPGGALGARPMDGAIHDLFQRRLIVGLYAKEKRGDRESHRAVTLRRISADGQEFGQHKGSRRPECENDNSRHKPDSSCLPI